MSEYLFVEKPFLDQLAALGWDVIDQGTGIPTDPTKSLRTSFREVILKGVFCDSVRAINTTEDGRRWLTDKQLEELYDELLSPAQPQPRGSQRSRPETPLPRPGRCQRTDRRAISRMSN